MFTAVIMAGGSGTRLWPASRKLHPKQFLSLLGTTTMLQSTLERLDGLDMAQPTLICNEQHRFLVAEQVRMFEKHPPTILLEPEGRNTAPSIALAALYENLQGNDPIFLVLAADHVIQNVEAFHAAVQRALPVAEAGRLVTFGVVPTHPETGYGYIQCGAAIGDAHEIRRFVEKPDQHTAESYLMEGGYLWNSGMFMFRASQYLAELGKYSPAIVEACERAMAGRRIDADFVRIDTESFLSCPTYSIDYAVFEHTQLGAVVSLDAGWSDIGSWGALWSISQKDECGNSLTGDVIAIDSRDTLVRAEDRVVSVLGVDGLVVVETKDAVLVTTRERAQDVKRVVDDLKVRSRSEHILHQEVYRPWGSYDSIKTGIRYQVKKITVKPGAKLSVQMHHHRAEHWVVVSGTAKVTNGDKTYLVTENQSTYIPIGEVHALENPGRIPLQLIEIQSGSYLGEDDIVRFEDRYGRA